GLGRGSIGGELGGPGCSVEPAPVRDSRGRSGRSLLEDLQRLPGHRASVLLGLEGVAVHDLTGDAADDEVGRARPRAPAVRYGGLGRVVGMAVVVAGYLEPRLVTLALDPDLVQGIHLVAVARALHDRVPDPPGLGDDRIAPDGDQDPADLVGVAVGGVGPNLLEGLSGDPHARR